MSIDLNNCQENHQTYYVYFIKEEGVVEWKVGHSCNPRNRLKNFRTGNPGSLFIYRKISNIPDVGKLSRSTAFKLENEIKRYLKKYKIRGEWFKIDQTLIDKLIQNIETKGFKFNEEKL